MLKRIILVISIIVGIFWAWIAFAVPSLPFQGGTGTGVTPASGTILIGNGTGTYTPTLLLGSGGITITNASGSVTINQGASGGAATTTINGVNGPSFTFATGTPLTLTVNGTTFTIGYNTSTALTISGQYSFTGGIVSSGNVTTTNITVSSTLNFQRAANGSTSQTSITQDSNDFLTFQSSGGTQGGGINAYTLFDVTAPTQTSNCTSSASAATSAQESTISLVRNMANGGQEYLDFTQMCYSAGSFPYIGDTIREVAVGTSSYLRPFTLGGSWSPTYGAGVLSAVNEFFKATPNNNQSSTQGWTVSLVGNTNVTGTFNASGLATFGNLSSTNITASGYLQVSGALTDPAGNKYSTSTGGGTPAGTSTNIQVNSGGVFYATSSFSYTSSTKQFVTNGIGVPTATSTNTTTTLSFAYTGATSSWTVPTGVTSINIEVRGGGSGASGGSASGTLAVTPGTTYYYLVGRAGASDGTTGLGGGGPSGGVGTTGGGDMSWFSASSSFATSTVVLVGGGGGGWAGGGTGGGLTGGTGTNNGSCTGGSGGTQSAGGAAGGGGATAGSAGQGGTGQNSGGTFGGGGGGGYFGGGGGTAQAASCQGAGGGGSSFMKSTLTVTSTASGVNAATGTVSIIYFPAAASVVAGTNNAFQVTQVGAQPAFSTTTIIFSQPFGNPPSCWAYANSATNTLLQVIPTTTSTAFIFQNGFSAGQTFTGGCLGY